MQPVTRIEIVIDELGAHVVIDLLAGLGLRGWTLLRNVEGSGERGLRRADELTGVNQNVYFLVACPPRETIAVVEAIRPHLSRIGGMCLVSDASWVIH